MKKSTKDNIFLFLFLIVIIIFSSDKWIKINRKYDIGNEIKIKYNPNNPKEIIVNAEIFDSGIIFILFSLIEFLLFMFFYIIFIEPIFSRYLNIKKSRITKSLFKNLLIGGL